MASILILGGDADGNLGDRAIQQAMCGSLAALRPDLELTVVSNDANRARRTSGASAIERGPRGFLAFCRAVRRSRLVLVGGGGLFQDDDSLVKMPYWAARIALVRLLGRPVVGYALGVGPLSSATGRASARLAFPLMRTITVRDAAAALVAQPLSAKPVTIVPDPAIGLRPAPRSVARETMRAAGVPLDGRPLVGVALRRWFPPAPRLIPHKIARRLGVADPQTGAEGQRLLDLVAQVLDRLVAIDDVFPVFLPSYTSTYEADHVLCRAVLDRMKQSRGAVVMVDDPSIYKACCGELAVLLGGRMHPMILAAAMGTPVVGLAYNPKFGGFLQLIGRADACVEVEDFVREGDPTVLAGLLGDALRAGRGPPDGAKSLAAQVLAFDAALLAEIT